MKYKVESWVTTWEGRRFNETSDYAAEVTETEDKIIVYVPDEAGSGIRVTIEKETIGGK